jgi:hypothetical protein
MQAPSNKLPMTANAVAHWIRNMETAAFGVDVIEAPDPDVVVPVMGVAMGVVGE